MDHFSFLETTAEISITFAGFVSIFLVLARRDGSFSPEFALTIRSILITSVACLCYAAFPLVLASMGVAGAALWRFPSAIFLMTLSGVGFYMATSRRRLPPTVRGTAFSRIAWSLVALTILALIANVAGWPLSPNPGVYLLSIWLQLGIASVNFLDLVFRGVLGRVDS